VIAWANEENGTRGASTYLEAQRASAGKHFAAIESDGGSGRPFGVRSSAPHAANKLLAPLQAALEPIGAGALLRADVLSTGDLSGLELAGVPSFMPLIDTSDYFHYHHTAADTLDKVDPQNLKRHVALMSTLTWYLANMEQPLGRWVAPVQQ
jgi:carboxypeptidase Q